jgi:hypothetical protein
MPSDHLEISIRFGSGRNFGRWPGRGVNQKHMSGEPYGEPLNAFANLNLLSKHVSKANQGSPAFRGSFRRWRTVGPVDPRVDSDRAATMVRVWRTFSTLYLPSRKLLPLFGSLSVSRAIGNIRFTVHMFFVI